MPQRSGKIKRYIGAHHEPLKHLQEKGSLVDHCSSQKLSRRGLSRKSLSHKTSTTALYFLSFHHSSLPNVQRHGSYPGPHDISPADTDHTGSDYGAESEHNQNITWLIEF